MKKLIKIILLFSTLLFVGWGYVGHYKISSNATKFFHPDMNEFLYWSDYLAAHASDPDKRKSDDPTEGYKHYIDIDNYPTFVSDGRIPNTMDSVVAMYGSSFVDDQGILPWATMTTVDSITAAFARRDFERALFFAADLGHYVGDGHMPLHITRNYNGQFTDQYGVHSRYESTMIGKYSSQINYSGDSVNYVSNVQAYIFEYLYENYTLVDSVLTADKKAKADAGSTSSDYFYQKLWEYTEDNTTMLFKKASKTIAELIYTSWVNAGSPELNPSDIDDANTINDFQLEQNYPNPFNPSTTIRYSIPNTTIANGVTQAEAISESSNGIRSSQNNVTLKIYSILGNEVASLVDKYQSAGNYEVQFNASNLTSGVYFYRLKSGNFLETKKMILLR